MKQSAALSLVLALLAAAPVLSHAQSSEMKGMDMKSGDMKGMDMGGKDSMSKGSTHKANGVVKALDAQKSTVTIAHGPVPTMKWPAMSMTFKIKDKALLDKLAVNKKVDVEFVEEGKDYVVTGVK
jgi:Cu(I)/Ag(I) efflux system periplasmic protein CusF